MSERKFAQLKIRLEPDLLQWVESNGGVDMVKQLIEDERARTAFRTGKDLEAPLIGSCRVCAGDGYHEDWCKYHEL